MSVGTAAIVYITLRAFSRPFYPKPLTRSTLSSGGTIHGFGSVYTVQYVKLVLFYLTKLGFLIKLKKQKTGLAPHKALLVMGSITADLSDTTCV